MARVLIDKVSYDVLIASVLIARADCTIPLQLSLTIRTRIEHELAKQISKIQSNLK